MCKISKPIKVAGVKYCIFVRIPLLLYPKLIKQGVAFDSHGHFLMFLGGIRDFNTISDVSKIGNACFSGQGAKFASSNPRGCDHSWIIVFGCPDFNSINPLTAE